MDILHYIPLRLTVGLDDGEVNGKAITDHYGRNLKSGDDRWSLSTKRFIGGV
jgi:hypothetical protein